MPLSTQSKTGILVGKRLYYAGRVESTLNGGFPLKLRRVRRSRQVMPLILLNAV